MTALWEVRYGDSRYTADLTTFDNLQDAVTFYNTEVRTMKFTELHHRVALVAPWNRICVRASWDPCSFQITERVYLNSNWYDTRVYKEGQTAPPLTAQMIGRLIDEAKYRYPWPGDNKIIDNPLDPEPLYVGANQ